MFAQVVPKWGGEGGGVAVTEGESDPSVRG